MADRVTRSAAKARPFRYDAFLSYSSRDKDWVRGSLVPALDSAKLRVCVDHRDFEVGNYAIREMERAVEESRHTIVVLSPNYLASDWTDFENILAQTADPAARLRKVLPVRIAPCEPPPRLAAIVYVDFVPPADPGEALDRLVQALRSSKGRKQAASAPARLPSPASPPAGGDRSARVTYHAVNSGPGAVGQGWNTVVAGQGGIAIGGFQPNVVVHPAPPVTRPRVDEEGLVAYREWIVRLHSGLPLRGIDLGASDATAPQKALRLASVFVDLATTARDETVKRKGKRSPSSRPLEDGDSEAPPLSALAALARNVRTVLLGAPGSGKSTLVGYVALGFAAGGVPNGAQADGESAKRLWTKEDRGLVPIPIALRDLAASLSEEVTSGSPKLIWDFWDRRVAEQSLGKTALDSIHSAAETGRAIVLFDGLDEVIGERQRKVVVEAVREFAERYSKTRVLVTCRTLSYQNPQWQLPDFTSFEIEPFDATRIDRFIHAWYAELATAGTVPETEANGLAERLTRAIRRPDLWRLAPSPLLLTVMSLVHTHRGRLPDARALLYEETVDLLLWRWEQLKQGGKEGPSLRRLMVQAEISDMDLKRTLWRLAFEVHGASGAADEDGVADLAEHVLARELASLHPTGDKSWADAVIDTIKHRAGLLLERSPGVYAFPHRTFQEYLAGAHLASQQQFSKTAAELTCDLDRWREVILLAVGRLVHVAGDTDKPLALVAELCPACGADDDAGWRRAWFAGEVLREVGVRRASNGTFGGDLLTRVRDRLADLLARSALTARERAEAGSVLADLGDPRPGVTSVDDMILCEVPAGPFHMGSNADKDVGPWDGRPAHIVETSGFRIGKWPVTVAQFAEFVADGAYLNARWWDGLKYSDGPAPLPPDFDRANQPMVYLRWYEAMAFTRWLTARWQGSGKIRPDQSVRLPSEAEWEKAARGSIRLADGEPNRRPAYPWGDQLEPERANFVDSRIDRTSAVGCFPRGSSPCGAEDLLGNVREWTCSEHRDYPYRTDDGRERFTAARRTRLVIRGGAFHGDPRFDRSAARYSLRPVDRSRSLGFRVIVSPP